MLPMMMVRKIRYREKRSHHLLTYTFGIPCVLGYYLLCWFFLFFFIKFINIRYKYHPMKLIYNDIFKKHDTGMHPENAKRLSFLTESEEVPSGEGYLTLYHTKEYIEKVKEACANGASLDPDTVTSKDSYEAAIRAVGATIVASENNDFAIVRPPGHHAHPDSSSGFCIFNNIAIAVQKLMEEGKKVLLLDIDGHLGDGTLKFFYDKDKVLYWSLHQFPAFPGGGDVGQIGEDKGMGYTICVPLPPGSADDIYRKAFDKFLPIARSFKPDVVAVSAGFDAHQYDLLLDLKLTVDTFHWIGARLKENFTNVFATLEGGYSIEMLPKCLYNFLDGINGKEKRYTERSTESMIQVMDEYEARVYLLEKNLSSFWRI